MTRWPSFAFTFSLLIVILENQYTTAVDNDEMLKDALEMIYQRQTELNPDQAVFLQQHQTYADAPLHNNRDRSELKSPYEIFYNRNGVNNLNMEQFLDYDDEEKTPAKRNPSVFRERIDHSEHPPHQYTGQAFENPDEDANDGELENELDYMNLLQNYWDKYKVMRKAAEQRHLNENTYGLYNYNQNGIPGRHYKRVPVSSWKSFPVSKRSSNAYPLQAAPAEKTDPKLESDLSHIFNEKKSEKSKTPKKVTNNGNEKKNNTKLERIKVAKQAKEQFVAKKDNNKEKVITKKSVDWSNYFGIDKRSGNRDENLGIEKRSAKGLKLNNVDEDWLVNRYREHLAKINGDSGDDSGYVDAKQRRDEAKLDAIKHKLKNIEDMIIDEAIKYTGAHEGEALDSKEVQHIKDRVMSRLAAVYSLEKMRHALTEFKKSIAEQRQNLKPIDLSGEMDFDVDPENSGPLASSVRYNGGVEKKSEHDHNKDDNNVTLTAEKVLSDGMNECQALEILQHQCSLLSNKIGEPLIQPLCMLYQVCSLCGTEESSNGPQNVVENSNADLTCYYIFAGESERTCAGETTCRRRANYALNTLRESEIPVFSGDLCPHQSACIDNAMENARRRLAYSPYIMGSKSN